MRPLLTNSELLSQTHLTIPSYASGYLICVNFLFASKIKKLNKLPIMKSLLKPILQFPSVLLADFLDIYSTLDAGTKSTKIYLSTNGSFLKDFLWSLVAFCMHFKGQNSRSFS